MSAAGYPAHGSSARSPRKPPESPTPRPGTGAEPTAPDTQGGPPTLTRSARPDPYARRTGNPRSLRRVGRPSILVYFQGRAGGGASGGRPSVSPVPILGCHSFASNFSRVLRSRTTTSRRQGEERSPCPVGSTHRFRSRRRRSGRPPPSLPLRQALPRHLPRPRRDPRNPLLPQSLPKARSQRPRRRPPVRPLRQAPPRRNRRPPRLPPKLPVQPRTSARVLLRKPTPRPNSEGVVS